MTGLQTDEILEELAEVLILRMHSLSDLVLDIPLHSRGRFIEEIQFASNAVNERPGWSFTEMDGE